jgi:hypothetical protein
MLEPCDAKGSRTVLRGLGDRKVTRYSAQSTTPSTVPAPTPKPMIRRVYGSITTRTQRVRNVADSQRNRSILQRLSFVWPRKVRQEGPPEPGLGQ